ncbi:MAG: retropepsin-like aspartic protease [Acetobacteraceae bacterium]|nr:retropepsin-like aspartic protease [Acetobacteraceae bacterium]
MEADSAAPATCKLEREADIPVKVSDGGLLVPALINQTPVQLQVDTGATGSMLDQLTVARLALPADARRTTTLHGTGGDVVTLNARVLSLEVGGEQWQSLSMATGRLLRRTQEDPPVAGLLGADRLASFDVELDVPHGRMVLWNVSHCSGDFVPWTVSHYAVPLVRHIPNRMVAEVAVNGQPVSALIDWGARNTVMTGGVANTLGITPAMLMHDRTGTSWGIDQNRTSFWVHPFDELRIGREVFHHVGIQVADVHAQEAGMLLGADYARTRRIWLSYATRQMFVVPPRLATADASP